MISVVNFNADQQLAFKNLLKDLSGPTSAVYLLSVLERAVYALGQPDIDPSCFGDDVELRDEFNVCMAALEYSRMSDIA